MDYKPNHYGQIPEADPGFFHVIWTSWWFQPTHLKNIRQNGNPPQIRVNIKTSLKPPTSECVFDIPQSVDSWTQQKPRKHHQIHLDES